MHSHHRAIAAGRRRFQRPLLNAGVNYAVIPLLEQLCHHNGRDGLERPIVDPPNLCVEIILGVLASNEAAFPLLFAGRPPYAAVTDATDTHALDDGTFHFLILSVRSDLA